MTLQESVKKSRAIRTTSAQYEELIKYMENHSEFAAGKFLTKEGKIHHAQQWEELAKMLNALFNGPGKSVKQWQTVWRDMKSNASKKATRLRNERNKTGNFPVNVQHLDNLEQRVIACMGLEYVQGAVDCPDSTPEEEEYQLQLENRNEDVLRYPPIITSIKEVLHNVNVASTSDDLDNHFETQSYIHSPEEVNGNSLSCSDVIQVLDRNESNSNNINENLNKTSRKQQRKQQILQNRKSRQRIGVQLQEAREQFGQIAENHATALQLFAEASMKQAEASLLAAQNEQKRIALEERSLEVKEKSSASNKQLIVVLNNLQKIIEQFYNI